MLSKHAALIHTMVLVSAVDRKMTDVELATIGRIVKYLPAFKGYDVAKLTETAKESAVILSTNDGLERQLSLIAAALDGPLGETAYALACEVAAADRKVPFEELRLLQLIRQKLGIDKLTAAAIERTTMARFAVV